MSPDGEFGDTRISQGGTRRGPLSGDSAVRPSGVLTRAFQNTGVSLGRSRVIWTVEIVSLVRYVESTSRVDEKSVVRDICTTTRSGRESPNPKALSVNAGVTEGNTLVPGASIVTD